MEILDHGLFDKEKGEFVLFQQFHTADDLADFTELLRKNDIAVRPQQENEGIGDVITGGSIKPKYWAEIQTNEFTKANEILKEEAERHLNEINLEEHYLNDLNNDELRDVLLKPEEWNNDALLIAEKLLEKRGAAVDKKEIQKAVSERKEKLRAPKSVSKPVLIICYIFALVCGGLFLVLPIVFYFAALITSFTTGVYFKFSKDTDTEGNRFYTFTPNIRKHGEYIMMLTAFSIPLLVLFSSLINSTTH